MGPIRYFSLVYPSLAKNFQVDIVCPQEFNIFPIKELALNHGLDLHQYSLIIVAAAWGSTSDKILLKKAKELKIPTCAIVDHWSWYKERFLLQDEFILPDYILLNDEFSKKECLALGFKEDNLIVLGNPVLEHRWDDIAKTPLNKTSQPFDSILFISECYKNSFPKGSEFDNGFDEFEVLDKILRCKKENDIIFVKLHPKETPDKYKDYENRVTIIDRLKNIDSYLINSNFVIGMGSMLLIEASLIRSDVMSFRPHQKIEFVGNKMGLTQLIEKEELLTKIFSHEIEVKNELKHFNFEGSTERIATFLTRIANAN